jgi:hypothetical protein
MWMPLFFENERKMNMKKKAIIEALFSGILHACKMTVTISFWRMAFIAFLLRVFVVRPFGPLLALTMGVVWCVGNVDRIISFMRTVHNRFTV